MDKCVQMLDKELLRLGPDGPVEEKDIREEPRLGWRKVKSPALDRESMRGEPWLERTGRVLKKDLSPRLKRKGRKDHERRWC
ncbi:hypothetical protein TNCV_4301461 [Trichonephila clavipes]|uniref:Uncharacterized protein n=1 Tax=Trichonephila clavipes TaxID=2585209 RepID=A0A8X6UZN7_TRICX|nr:hypothetical protein TNCV_4301461 [Trichonephila clavipes]